MAVRTNATIKQNDYTNADYFQIEDNMIYDMRELRILKACGKYDDLRKLFRRSLQGIG